MEQNFEKSKIDSTSMYCIVFIHLYRASCSAHKSEALPERETQREESKRAVLGERKEALG